MQSSDFTIATKADMIAALDRWGFLPLFRNSIPGFSVEEHASPRVWFSDEPGVWEWKGPVIRETGCAYGKFFDKKAVFVTAEWFADFANYRRDGYDFDARCDDGLAPFPDQTLYELLDGSVPILSKDLKRIGDYRKGGRKGFETSMTRLQTQCYVIIRDFVYLRDKHGKLYGWGVAEYSTPERELGERFRAHVYDRTPEESRERIVEHLLNVVPNATEETVRKLIK